MLFFHFLRPLQRVAQLMPQSKLWLSTPQLLAGPRGYTTAQLESPPVWLEPGATALKQDWTAFVLARFDARTRVDAQVPCREAWCLSRAMQAQHKQVRARLSTALQLALGTTTKPLHQPGQLLPAEWRAAALAAGQQVQLAAQHAAQCAQRGGVCEVKGLEEQQQQHSSLRAAQRQLFTSPLAANSSQFLGHVYLSGGAGAPGAQAGGPGTAVSRPCRPGNVACTSEADLALQLTLLLAPARCWRLVLHRVQSGLVPEH